MYVVLVTDFATVERVVGPFTTRKQAHDWAFRHLPEVYRVCELQPPEGAPAGTRSEPAAEHRGMR